MKNSVRTPQLGSYFIVISTVTLLLIMFLGPREQLEHLGVDKSGWWFVYVFSMYSLSCMGLAHVVYSFRTGGWVRRALLFRAQMMFAIGAVMFILYKAFFLNGSFLFPFSNVGVLEIWGLIFLGTSFLLFLIARSIPNDSPGIDYEIPSSSRKKRSKHSRFK
jgi:hypothetical protein